MRLTSLEPSCNRLQRASGHRLDSRTSVRLAQHEYSWILLDLVFYFTMCLVPKTSTSLGCTDWFLYYLFVCVVLFLYELIRKHCLAYNKQNLYKSVCHGIIDAQCKSIMSHLNIAFFSSFSCDYRRPFWEQVTVCWFWNYCNISEL